MKRFTPLALLLVFVTLQSCGTSGKGSLYVEPSISRTDIQIHRVAIVPNRLPMNLQNPEKWRRYNWEVIKQEFEKREYTVVDYETSVATFNKSGLPVEDTKSSRDKYSDLANQLGVDIIIIPYYGTYAASKNILFLFNNSSYYSVATFKIYLTKQNDFFARIDVNGKNQYTSNLLTLVGAGVSFADGTAGAITMGVGGIWDLYQGLKSSDSRWKRAFKKAIKEGLKPFWASYGK